MLSAVISIETCSERLAEALARALRVEAEHPPDPERGEAKVERKGTRVVVRIRARDASSARALINAFLTLASSLWDTLEGADVVQEKSENKH